MITKHECCNRTLEILLRNVRHLEDLVLVESIIEDYQDAFKVNLIMYKLEVAKMREVYRKNRPYLSQRR